MPAMIFLKMTGELSKDIVGSSIEKGNEKAIDVMSFDHSISSPYDPYSSTTMAGTRRHSPLTILKAIDVSSPLIMQMLITGEQITKFTLDLWHNDKGVMKKYYTIELEKVRVAQISTDASGSHLERISFTYGKIVWTWAADTTKTTQDTLSNLDPKAT